MVTLKIVSNVSRFKLALNLNRVLADLNLGSNSLNSISDDLLFVTIVHRIKIYIWGHKVVLVIPNKLYLLRLSSTVCRIFPFPKTRNPIPIMLNWNMKYLRQKINVFNLAKNRFDKKVNKHCMAEKTLQGAPPQIFLIKVSKIGVRF